MDYTLFKAINGVSGSAVPDAIVTFLARDLAQVMMALVALLFLVPWSRHRDERRSGAAVATVAAGLALEINQPIAHLIDRARPYVAHPTAAHLLIARSPDPSFPSDHATGAFALAAGIWLYDRTLGSMLLGLAAAMAFSRVYVGTHYPSDVLAGAAIGIGVAVALHLLPTRRLLEATAGLAGSAWDTLWRAVRGSAARTDPA